MELEHLRNPEEIKEGLVALIDVFIDEYPYYYEWINKSKKQIESYEKEIIAIKADNEIVGYAMIHNSDDKYFKINGIYIFPKHEGKRYATKSILNILKEGELKGKDYALIQTRTHNKKVIHLFKKIGFNILGNNYHAIEKKDNVVAVYDIQRKENMNEMIETARKEYPGFEHIEEEKIDSFIENSSKKHPPKKK